mmetsp:Transcript_1868/g.2178  ORF Transcript_1868/g.2178 Transcript_1868/m.2178 type:complete len:262 (+) Transcript_1868:3-788(+)
MDIHECHTVFHEFGKGGKVYLLTNDPTHCDLNVAVDQFQNFFSSHMQQLSSNRDPNVGLRLALILLDSQWRNEVSVIMKNKKDRVASDQTGDTELHFYEKILDEAYSNPHYVASFPSDEFMLKFPESERSAWDPNDPKIFDVPRDAKWLRETYEKYIRRFYRDALKRSTRRPVVGMEPLLVLLIIARQATDGLLLFFVVILSVHSYLQVKPQERCHGIYNLKVVLKMMMQFHASPLQLPLHLYQRNVKIWELSMTILSMLL